MFTAWRLENFKSVRGPAELALAPLTCLTGANSSGKSTVLQSMLMLAQTLQGNLSRRALLLNGPLVQLGGVTEVVARGEGIEAFSVGFTLQGRVSLDFHRGASARVRCDAVFAAGETSDTAALEPALRSVEVEVAIRHEEGGERESLRVERSPHSPRDRAVALGMGDIHDEGIAGLAFEVRSEGPPGVGAVLSHFIPTAIIDEAYVDQRPDLEERPLTGAYYTGIDLLRRRFDRLRHLDAMRAPPATLHSYVVIGDATFVGAHGESAIAAFQVHRRSVVYAASPDEFVHRSSQAAEEPVTFAGAPLEELSLSWLRYLGVVEHWVADHRGSLGHEVRVSVPGGSGLDHLTQVGTGVSQVLPVVLACLLAEPDSTVLLEQPELHLHPAVQSRLADFFLAMALSGRQVIVETHSEYLINRLRCRIAVASGDSLLPLVKVYFAERKDGASTFRPLAIDRYGGIVEWPDGFFDESEREVERILVEGMRKRQGDRGQGG